MQRPLVLFSLGMILGIWLANGLDQSSLFYLGLGTPIFLFILLFYFRKGRGYFLLIGCLGFLLGAVRYAYADEGNQSTLDTILNTQDSVLYVVQGEVKTVPILKGSRSTFDLKVKQIQVGSKRWAIPEETIRVSLYLNTHEDEKKLRTVERGTHIMVPLTLEKPVSARNPGGFDYRAFLHKESIHWLGKGVRFHELKIESSSNHPLKWLDRLRTKLAVRLEHHYEEPYAGLLRGMLLGERQAIDPELEEDYSLLGLTHILSISGLHVGIIVGCFYSLFIRLGLTREKAAGCILLFLPMYVCLTGAEAPVIRSAIMTGMVLVAMIFRYYQDILSFLAFSFVIQCAWNPYYLFDVGFQLTYLITAALVMGVRPIAEKMSLSSEWIKQSLAVTLIAHMVSFPMIIYYFSSFSLLSFLANLLLVPFFGLIIPLAMGGIVVEWMSSTIGSMIAQVVSMILAITTKGIEWLVSMSWAHLSWARPSVLWLILYGTITIYLWIAWIGDVFYQRVHRWIASTGFIILIGYAYFSPLWPKETRLTFLDVGQGDAIVIETAGGKVIVVDGGGQIGLEERGRKKQRRLDMGKRVLVPYLTYRGIRQIDELVLTHGDLDHIGGIQTLVERFPVKRVIRNPHLPHGETEQKLMDELMKRGVPVYAASAGKIEELENGMRWQFLHPDPHRLLGESNQTNNDSVVFLLSIYQFQVLMTGDMEAPAEQMILTKWKLPPIDILKVAHHGSDTSTTTAWLKELQPREAVISVGMKNRYGHPSPHVLERLNEHRIRVWRTDQHGAITIIFKPEQYQVESMLGSNK
ncbi:DNA internalization-related competence protein ComEC/Rec2 [Thermoflavimicrobium dichotomicum]|nr:DNA internalization-related competence protein ComEC/Rec2 [Thermoflavimicrobium dichotomicum]